MPRKIKCRWSQDHPIMEHSPSQSTNVELLNTVTLMICRPDSWAEALDERDKLLAVLEAFQLKQKHEPGQKMINVRSCSWPEVMKLIARAEDQYKNEKITGVLGGLRKCLRKLGDNGATFENWLRVLPDGDYGSIISGSFHVIIQVSCPQLLPRLGSRTYLVLPNSRPRRKCLEFVTACFRHWQIFQISLHEPRCISRSTSFTRPVD